MAHAPLEYRKPQTTWMITAAFFSLCLHGVCWFIAKQLLGDEEALANTQRQMVLGLFWMIGALAIWRVVPPPSRLHAYMIAIVCAVFVSLLGSLVVLIKLAFIDRYELNGNFMSSFAMLGGLVMLAHFLSALPSAALLQGVALTRPSSTAKAE
jgi:hypothetical protein